MMDNKKVALWKLIQSLGGPDEQLSWNVADALEDIIQKEPDLVKDIIVEGLVKEYDDWNPQLTLKRLAWFSNKGILNKKFIKDVLLSAKSDLEEEVYELPNLFYVKDALEDLEDSSLSSKMTRANLRPVTKSLLPDLNITGGSTIQVFATDEESVSKLDRALDSEDSQTRKAAAETLRSIMEFDYEFPRVANTESTFYKALKRAIDSPDKT